NSDLNKLIREKPDAFKEHHLLLNCEITDEFGLKDASEQLHKTLLDLNINHDYEIYSEPKAALSPHILGIGSKILTGIRFCLKYF
ncbi:MAG: hypothetical protein ACFE9N_04675, partial [Promethearchaeota archaeon]